VEPATAAAVSRKSVAFALDEARMRSHMRSVQPVETGACRKATPIVDAAGIEETTERPRIRRRAMSIVCALLVAAAALFAAPRGDQAAGALDAVAVGSLAIQDGEGDIATMLVRQVVVDAGDGKRLPAEGPGFGLPPSHRGVPGVSAHVRLSPGSRPRAVDAGLLESNRIPTGPPVA